MPTKKARFIPMTRELSKLKATAAKVAEKAGAETAGYVSDQMGRRMYPDVSIVSDEVPRGIGFTRWPDGTISVSGDPVGQRDWARYAAMFFNYLGALVAKEAVEAKMGGKAGDPVFEGDSVRLDVELDCSKLSLKFLDGLNVEVSSDHLGGEELSKKLDELLYWLTHPSIREKTAAPARR